MFSILRDRYLAEDISGCLAQSLRNALCDSGVLEEISEDDEAIKSPRLLSTKHLHIWRVIMAVTIWWYRRGSVRYHTTPNYPLGPHPSLTSHHLNPPHPPPHEPSPTTTPFPPPHHPHHPHHPDHHRDHHPYLPPPLPPTREAVQVEGRRPWKPPKFPFRVLLVPKHQAIATILESPRVGSQS